MALKRDLKQYVERTSDKTLNATLGVLNSDGSYTLHVPGNRGYVYVTYGAPGSFGSHVGVARGFSGGTPGMPVKIKVRFGIGEIVGSDYDQLPAYAPGTNVLPTTIPAHTHAIGSGMTDPVEGLRFVPGLVRPYKVSGAYGLVVWIEGVFYKHAGQVTYFAPQAVDLTSYVPGTANKKAWVVVGIDPATNTATATTGTEYALAVTMNPSQLTGFSFAGKIPLAAVVLENGQTAINNILAFADIRPYVSAAVDTGTMTLSASDLFPSTTAGCAAATKTEHTTNDVDIITLDFDQTTDEFAQWSAWMPDDWNAGTLTAQFAWTAAGASSGDVIWGLQGRSYANDDAIDQAWGTAQTVTDTWLANGDIHYTSETSAITLAGTPAAGELIQVRVYRDANAGGDTLDADARLIAVKLRYTRG